MFSIKSFLSSIGKRYVLQKSEIKRSGPNESGLYRYIRYEIFTDKKEKKGALGRAYHTALVKDKVPPEYAMENSVSFKFNLDNDKALLNKNENKNIRITYYNCGNNEKDNTHTGGQIWEFQDGSYIEERVTLKT